MRKISPIRALTVLCPVCSKDGSAWRDGQIKVGDEVVAVDSKSVIGWSHDDLVNAIAGQLRRVHCHLSGTRV
jgi:C-terminal processing protease CtpA/Prc